MILHDTWFEGRWVKFSVMLLDVTVKAHYVYKSKENAYFICTHAKEGGNESPKA